MPSTLRNTGRTPAFKPADLLPSVDPPYPVVRPQVPTQTSRIAFTAPSQDPESSAIESWISTTHFYPAAWPRSHVRSAKSDVYQPNLPSSSSLEPLPTDPEASKAEQRRRRQADFQIWADICGGPEKEPQALRMEELRDSCEKAHHTERLTQARTANEQQLWMAVNRIRPSVLEHDSDKPSQKGTDGRQGLTLILCHANGFHKEIFEPALSAFISKLTSKEYKGKYKIDEIWNFDTTHSGHSASINRDVLGDTISWADHARDVIKFFDSYVPPAQKAGPTPWLPTFLPTSKSGTKEQRRYLALGHSFGGAALCNVLHARPNLLEGFVLIDPAIFEMDDAGFDTLKLPMQGLPYPVDVPLAKGAIARKDHFDSLPDAQVYFESKPFFKIWTPKVLDLHLRFGLRPSFIPISKALVADDVGENDLKRTKLELTNTKWHEAAAFASTWMSRMGRKALVDGEFRAWTALLTMKGGFDNQTLAKDISKRNNGIAYTVPGNHLVAQEDPETLADYLVKVLDVQSDPQALKREKLHTQIEKPRL